jgi:hypothetical protein
MRALVEAKLLRQGGELAKARVWEQAVKDFVATYDTDVRERRDAYLDRLRAREYEECCMGSRLAEWMDSGEPQSASAAHDPITSDEIESDVSDVAVFPRRDVEAPVTHTPVAVPLTPRQHLRVAAPPPQHTPAQNSQPAAPLLQGTPTEASLADFYTSLQELTFAQQSLWVPFETIARRMGVPMLAVNMLVSHASEKFLVQKEAGFA